MMTSQLGRMILDVSGASVDEMTATPDQAGRYAPIDSLLGDRAVQIRDGPRSRGDRRPEECFEELSGGRLSGPLDDRVNLLHVESPECCGPDVPQR